jgi:redox-sensitive bicupin YhaK (pirin superfamily)
MTFVFAGENAHYDTSTAKWTPLRAGDFQIIRSGSGLSHAERIAKGTRAFQIWFDPDMDRSVREPPAYHDHTSRDVPTILADGVAMTEYVGGASKVRPATEGLAIRKLSFAKMGHHALTLADGKRYAIYVLAGSARLDGRAASANDLMNAAGGTLDVAHDPGCELFLIELPIAPSYVPLVEPMRSAS